MRRFSTSDARFALFNIKRDIAQSLASAYPFAMQFLPSMKGGRWEKVEGEATRELIKRPKQIEQSCILSIYRVRFNFYVDAPFYALPYRLPDSVILYPRMGAGYYMRDDVLNAIDWYRKFKVPISKALIVEEANFFHPASDAASVPFALIADIYAKRIEFDKKDPKGPEQSVLKGGINSAYGKLAERRYRGDDPETGEPIIPPHACPWYAAAIIAHTRRELMKVALIAPELVIGFATDAIYMECCPIFQGSKRKPISRPEKRTSCSAIGAGPRFLPLSLFRAGWLFILMTMVRLSKSNAVGYL